MPVLELTLELSVLALELPDLLAMGAGSRLEVILGVRMVERVLLLVDSIHDSLLVGGQASGSEREERGEEGGGVEA